MNTDRSQLEEAQFLARKVVSLLHPNSSWAKPLGHLASCLEAGDIEGAVEARKLLRSGMGGFDEFLEANPEFQEPCKSLSELVGKLKVQCRYGLQDAREK